MSERSTALFVSGHVPPEELVDALLRTPGVSAADFQGEEAPRVGHGRYKDVAYTHLSLRLFELGGLILIDRAELPGNDEVEIYLGTTLSATHGKALYLHYDDEQGVGGHALFVDGVLTSREAVDGRFDEPVKRTLAGEARLEQVDTSHWVWPQIAEAVEAGAKQLFGEGVRSDDDIEALIKAAAATPVARRAAAPSASAAGPGVAGPRGGSRSPSASASEPKRRRKRDRVFGLLKGIVGGD